MSENQNTESQEMKFELEVAPIESITKAEIDVQIATAHQFPRSLAQFNKRAEAMVTQDVETAESCIYRLTRYDKRTGEKKVIEGESIRMAEIVAACYGNMRSAVHVVGHTPTRVSVRAVAHDLETNNLIAVEKQAKTAYSDGTPYNEDMAITTANATVSKALRDAIFRVVPKALIKPLKEKAKLVAFGSGAAFVERRHKAWLWATVTRKVPVDRVLAVLGVKGEEDMSVEHLEILTGLKTAIMEGDQTVDEAFPPIEPISKPVFDHPAKKEQEAAKAATMAAPATTAKAKAKVDPKPEPKTITVVADVKPSPAPTPEPVATPTPPAAVPEPAAAVEVQAPVSAPPAETTPEPEPPPQEPEAEQTSEPEAQFTEPPPEEPAAPRSMSEAQTQLMEMVTCPKNKGGMGFTWEDFLGWAKTAVPKVKAKPPEGWMDISDDDCRFYIKQRLGVSAGITTWKKK